MKGKRQWATCEVCGGPAVTRYDAVRDEYDPDTWLHLHSDDWADNPHNVVPTKISDEPR